MESRGRIFELTINKHVIKIVKFNFISKLIFDWKND